MSDVPYTPKPPYKMRNGAELIGLCMNFEQNHGIVLCRWRKSEERVGRNNPEGWEWVTWRVAISDREVGWDQQRDTFIPLLVAEVGHYFYTYGEATEDYYNRIIKGY